MSLQLTYYLRQGIIRGVASGKPIHLSAQRGNNNQHEIYDYPGEYAQRFDGIDKGKAELPSGLLRNKSVSGNSGAACCSHFTPGGKFKIQQHRAASRFSGQYYISSVTHNCRGVIYLLAKGMAFIDNGNKGGFFIHGGPPCNSKRCIVVPHGLDDLLKILSEEGGGVIHIRP